MKTCLIIVLVCTAVSLPICAQSDRQQFVGFIGGGMTFPVGQLKRRTDGIGLHGSARGGIMLANEPIGIIAGVDFHGFPSYDGILLFGADVILNLESTSSSSEIYLVFGGGVARIARSTGSFVEVGGGVRFDALYVSFRLLNTKTGSVDLSMLPISFGIFW